MTLTLEIHPDLELHLTRVARERGIDTDQCVLRLLEESLSNTAQRSGKPLETDPLMAMAGADDFDPAGIDEVVYR